MPTVRHKRGTSANLASVNPVPLDGEIVYDQTENAIKIGDGSTAWTSLAYVTATPRTHVHDGDDITTGTVAYARLPVGSTASTVCAGDDARLSDARSPTAHKSTHATGGSDALTPSDIGAAPAASPTFTGTATFEGVILADDSTSTSAPVYSFTGDTNCGIGHPAADTVAISTAGVERMRVEADGRVSFGPPNTNAANGIRLSRDLTGGTGVNGIIAQQTVLNDVTASAVVYRSFTGTQAAAFTLPLLAHFMASANTFGAGSTVTEQVGFYVSSGLTAATFNIGVRSDIFNASNRWNFYASGTAPNYFAGNVGIGTNSPASALHVNGVITVSAGTAAAPALVASGDPNTGAFFPAADTFAISTAGSERVRVDSSGRVGIGRTPSVSGTSLEVAGNIFIPATKSIQFALTNAGAGLGTPSNNGFQFWAASNSQNYMRFQGYDTSTQTFAATDIMRVVTGGTGAGNVGIQTNSPTARLDINADTMRLRTARTPASAAAAGNAGDICWDASYLYICTATNTWRRIAHDTW